MYNLIHGVALLAASQKRAGSYAGNGFLAGNAPNVDVQDDGRARVMNVPARIDITVLEPITYTVVARTWSRPDGTWMVPYLDEDQHFTVVGSDRSMQVNSAIQDWVRPAVLPDDWHAVTPRLSGRLPSATVGFPWRGEIQFIAGVDARIDEIVISGLPSWVEVMSHDTGAYLRGTPDEDGLFAITVAAVVEDEVVATAASEIAVQPALASAIRMKVTANSGDGTYVSVTEFIARSVPAGPNLCVGGTWFESSSANALNTAAFVFDGDMGTKWTAVRPTGSVPQHFGYTFASPVSISEIAVGSPISGQLAMAPADFVIEIKVGESWLPVVARTGEGGWVPGQYKVYSV